MLNTRHRVLRGATSLGTLFVGFLSKSSYFFLNNDTRIRISTSMNHINVPDLTLTNSLYLNFDWRIVEE